MMHAYYGVICKTVGCGAELYSSGSYLGPREATDRTIKTDFEPPEKAEIPCPYCKKSHLYLKAEFRVVLEPNRLEPESEPSA